MTGSQQPLFPRVRQTEDGRAYELPVVSTAELPPRTHRNDPVSSHEAEAWMRDTGKLAAQARQALELIRRHPGRTSKELALATDALDRYQLARRLADLREQGFARTTGGGKGEGELRWWAA